MTDNCYWDRLLFFLYQALIASDRCSDLADCHSCVKTRLGTVTGRVVRVLGPGGCATCGWCPRHPGCCVAEQCGSGDEPRAADWSQEGSSNARFGTCICLDLPWRSGRAEASCQPGRGSLAVRHLPQPVSGSLPGTERSWQRPRAIPPAGGSGVSPGSQHVWGRGARHSGPWRRWDMPEWCPLPQGNWAAPKHWAALLQPRGWSMA